MNERLQGHNRPLRTTRPYDTLWRAAGFSRFEARIQRQVGVHSRNRYRQGFKRLELLTVWADGLICLEEKMG
jgi:hypothetical protein